MVKIYQNRAFWCLMARNTKMRTAGIIHTAAKPVKPVDENWYSASRNKRKSMRTLPP